MVRAEGLLGDEERLDPALDLQLDAVQLLVELLLESGHMLLEALEVCRPARVDEGLLKDQRHPKLAGQRLHVAALRVEGAQIRGELLHAPVRLNLDAPKPQNPKTPSS